MLWIVDYMLAQFCPESVMYADYSMYVWHGLKNVKSFCNKWTWYITHPCRYLLVFTTGMEFLSLPCVFLWWSGAAISTSFSAWDASLLKFTMLVIRCLVSRTLKLQSECHFSIWNHQKAFALENCCITFCMCFVWISSWILTSVKTWSQDFI